MSMPDQIKVDLHSHTTVSDGRLTPQELAAAAVRAGLDVLAVTDHDTTDGIDEVLKAAQGTRLRVIPGIEVSTHYDNLEIHVLGYIPGYRSQALQDRLTELRQTRRERIHKIVAALGAFGIKIDADEVFAVAKGRSVGRPHVARVLVSKGYVSTTGQAFKQYLGHNAPAYVRTHELKPAEAFAMIRNAGGIPVVAHPAFIGDDSVIPPLVGEGLMGIEVFHRYDDQSVWDTYLGLAKRYKLLVTGGSDFHGYEDSAKSSDLGEVTLPGEYFRDFEKALNGPAQ